MNEELISNAENKTLYKIAGIAALVAMAANILDVILGFGEKDIIAYGAKSAIEWFFIFQENRFMGLYTLGILNIVYMLCMVPVYLALFAAHRRRYYYVPIIATVIFLISLAIYISCSAAIPMSVLSEKYASSASDAQRALIAAAGESVLARGEDFTPGAFPGLFLSGIAAIMISIIMLRGGIFSKLNSWTGIIGFTFLTLFTILATFVHPLFFIAYYLFGMLGGVFILAWFIISALRFFKLGRI